MVSHSACNGGCSGSDHDKVSHNGSQGLRRCRVLLLGLDSAGKATLLYKLKLGETVVTLPTIGYNVETFQYNNDEFKAWDIGGLLTLHLTWKHYFGRTDVIIYVVDAANRSRIKEAARELHYVFQYEELEDAKLLVFANKQDQPGCMKTEELEAKVNLPAVTKNLHLIQKTEGIYEGLD